MKNRPKLVLASKNKHKVLELQALLRAHWEVVGCAEIAPNLSWDEDGTSFRENALIKAKAVREITSDYILADDSGLAVEALQGAPGVYSSRYAGVEGDDKANNLKLLASLEQVPEGQRTASFMCCLCLLRPDNSVKYFEGECRGSILRNFVGTGGFGYDPLFWVEEADKSMAELSLEEKNQLSHRARALQKFLLES